MSKEASGYGQRLKEITSVLHKHEITRGVSPIKLREILEDLGPTYIKLGQIMSMRSDILPKRYCEELMRLRSEVTPMAFWQVREVIESSYGCPMEEVFKKIEEKSLGSASIAQVHRARLKSGEDVVVKVQRMGIYETMARDIRLLHRAVKLLPPVNMKELVDLDMILDEMWTVAQEEMNFLTEASNMEEFAELNQGVAYFETPVLYREYTTSKVLVMGYVDGYSIDDTAGLLEGGYDLNEIGLKLTDHYVKQIMEDGFFHADPHPGNLRIKDGKIVWMDMGMMGRLSKRDKKLTGDVVKGMAKGDTSQVVEAVMALGDFKEDPDQVRFYSDIDKLLEKYGTEDMGDIDIAKVLEDLMEIMKCHQIAMPHGLTMLGRGMTTLEGVIAQISPEINMVQVASARMAESLWHNFDVKKHLMEDTKTLYQAVHTTMKIPILVEGMLQGYKKGQTRINLDLHTTQDLSDILQKMVRELVFGLLIAALLIGSSIICTTQMKPQFLGIPALGAAGYILALILAIYVFFKHLNKKKR